MIRTEDRGGDEKGEGVERSDEGKRRGDGRGREKSERGLLRPEDAVQTGFLSCISILLPGPHSVPGK